MQGVKAATEYGDATDEVAENMAALKGDARSVANAYKSLNSTLTQVANNQYYRNKYAAGDRDQETISAIASMTGLDEKTVKEHEDYVNSILDEMYEGDKESIQNMVSAYDQFITDDSFVVPLPELQTSGGSVDLSDAINGMTAEAAGQLQSLADG